MLSFFFLLISTFSGDSSSISHNNKRNTQPIKNIRNPVLNESIFSIIFTILTSDGEILTEVNDLSDAIKHCRSGCGIGIPGGEGLVAEMRRDKDYQSYFVGTNSVVTNAFVSAVKDAAKLEDEGKISKKFSSGRVFWADTIGHYAPSVQIDGYFRCAKMSQSSTDVNSQKECEFYGTTAIVGTDRWDFDTHDDWPTWKNWILEIIPEFLVSLRGNMVPFDVHYYDKEEISGIVHV